MISFDNHQADVLALYDAGSTPLRIDAAVPVIKATGRVLAANVPAVLPVPVFSNSAMDGFAVLRTDLDQGLRKFPVAADVPAGVAPVTVPPGTAVRIMTGAPVVEAQKDLLAIIPVEDTNVPPGPVALPAEIEVQAVGKKSHIRARGESCAVGDVVMSAGSVIDAGAIAALISTGIESVDVYGLPRVAVISSGNELCPPSQQLGPGQIPDSNTSMIANLIQKLLPSAVDTYHLGDDPQRFGQRLLALAADVDVIITTGGVSAGAFDVVKQSLSSGEQVQMEFRKLAMQPGKPQGFGLVHGTPVVCLPGNPVSAFVSFQLFVRPLLQRIAGVFEVLPQRKLSLAVGADLQVSPQRDLFVPCVIDWARQVAQITIPAGKGSHFVASLVGITGIIHVPANRQSVVAGDQVTVYLL